MNRPGVLHAPLELNHPRSEPGFTLTASRRPFSAPPGGVPAARVGVGASQRPAGGGGRAGGRARCVRAARCCRAVRTVPRGGTGQRPVGALSRGRLPRAAAGGAPAASGGTPPFPRRPQGCERESGGEGRARLGAASSRSGAVRASLLGVTDTKSWGAITYFWCLCELSGYGQGFIFYARFNI